MTQYQEPFRPQFHFSPPAGWMNDPNGMYYLDGEFHLCYQLIPETHDHTGQKNWGHAVSPDLLHWQHWPLALSANEGGEIWSGCAVVDHHNSSGLQTGDEPVIVAHFTHVFNGDTGDGDIDPRHGRQAQYAAYSNDRGRTWTWLEHNPVIDNPGLPDFRDPNVIWHAPSQRWVLVLAAGDRVMIYTSHNLLDWDKASEFGPGVGCLGGVWECPALFSLPLPGPGGGEKWVLLVSLGGGAPNGGSGTEYFIGDFDGERFSSDHASDTAFWLDYGRDNYAAIPFTSMPDSAPRLILVGWMSNWWYAADTPTVPWRGQMTIPREARLVRTGDGVRLATQPVAELAALRQEHQSITNVPLLETTALPQMSAELPGRFEVALVVANGEASEWGICLQNSAGEETIIGYDVEGRRLFVNRQRSGNIDFHRDFAGFQHGAKLLAEDDEVALRIYVDWSSIEVCAGEGVVWLSELIFPQQPVSGMTFYARGGQASLQQLDVWTLQSVW